MLGLPQPAELEAAEKMLLEMQDTKRAELVVEEVIEPEPWMESMPDVFAVQYTNGKAVGMAPADWKDKAVPSSDEALRLRSAAADARKLHLQQAFDKATAAGDRTTAEALVEQTKAAAERSAEWAEQLEQRRAAAAAAAGAQY